MGPCLSPFRPAEASDADFLSRMLVAAAFWRPDGPHTLALSVQVAVTPNYSALLIPATCTSPGRALRLGRSYRTLVQVWS